MGEVSTSGLSGVAGRQGVRVRQLLPGLIVVGVIAGAAWVLGGYVPLIGAAVFGLLGGLMLGGTVGIPATVRPGIDYTLKRLLRLAIILFGTSLSFAEVIRLGAGSLSVILVTIVLAIGLTYLFGLWLRAPSRLVSLIGVGTAICGATAIITVGPIIEAREDETAFAVTTIFLFNMVAVVVYPLLGHAMGLSDLVFGTWAGTAIHDTSSVLAASYTFSDTAGKVATVVKLTRTLMLVPLALLAGLVHSYQVSRTGARTGARVDLVKTFPWFVLWFVTAALLNTFGLFSASLVRLGAQTGKFLIVMVMVAVGLGADLKRMQQIGLRPFVIGLFASVLIAVTSITLIRALVD